MNLNETTLVCAELAIKAGDAIMDIYRGDNITVKYKSDNTPLTLADKVANDIIVSALREEYPLCAILAEESHEADNRSRVFREYCFIVDPLDGTKEFIARTGQFTVNIALSHNGESVVGVIYVPVTEELYYAYRGYGAYYQNNPEATAVKLSVTDKLENLIFVGSKSHATEREEQLLKEKSSLISSVTTVGSSLKGCMVARGIADVYYRYGLTNEWDTAAMQCIVEQAGGVFRQADGSEMRYNRKDILNRKGFLAVNRRENIWLIEPPA
jgi:3'(2'), 5'-bisphosphate nucleotidase